MAYTLQLTQDEYHSLQWLEDHGYAADMITHASSIEGEETETVTLHYRECDAWEVAEAADADPHAFGACATRPLLAKMRAFVDGIV